jgi:hypothetical protein
MKKKRYCYLVESMYDDFEYRFFRKHAIFVNRKDAMIFKKEFLEKRKEIKNKLCMARKTKDEELIYKAEEAYDEVREFRRIYIIKFELQ